MVGLLTKPYGCRWLMRVGIPPPLSSILECIMVSGYLEVNIDLSTFEEGQKTLNCVEMMDIFWKIVDQMPEQRGLVPKDGVTKAYWKIKPYLNKEEF